ncbi:MAG: hypothetical protein MRY59_04250 [Aquisalinus sp.]|nr:hypothetical protein [Aquisalinus sp.]
MDDNMNNPKLELSRIERSDAECWQMDNVSRNTSFAPVQTQATVIKRECALFPYEDKIFAVFDKMTDRQKSIIVGFGLGYDVGKIATECNIETSTVYTYRKRMMGNFKKLSGPQFIILCALWVRVRAYQQGGSNNVASGAYSE